MQITWEADNSDFRGRKRVRRACSRCKKLKKRCDHTFDTFDPEEEGSIYNPPAKRRDVQNSSVNESRSLVSRQASGLWISKPRNRSSSSLTSPGGMADHTGDSEPDRGEEHRFLGDMNPEAALLDQQDSLCRDPQRNLVGIYHQKTSYGPSSDDETTAVVNDSLQKHVKIHLRNYLTAIGAFDMPTMSTQEKLIDIYFSQLNSILPLIDKPSFLQAFEARTASQLLIQSICLVAAKDDAAAPDLRFQANSPSLGSRVFCTKLYTGLAASVNANIENDHITLARVLALMSLHCEGYQGADASSMHLTQAIHHSQSVSLQIAPLEDDRQGVQKRDLFWCLWSLDKLHASMDGRAIMIADRDISVSRPASTMKRKSAFEIWFEISEMLAKVIDYYRPTAQPETTGWEENFPSFEDVIGDDVGSDLQPDILAVLELYYHAVAIVSRRSRPLQRPAPSTSSLVRQTLSALRIQALLTDEFPSGLPPIPIVPYAVSLAMTVAYRQLRQSKIITHFNRAKANLEASCTLLEHLGQTWWTARGLARLGRRALRSVDEMQDKNTTRKAESGKKKKARKLAHERPSVVSDNISSPATDGFARQWRRYDTTNSDQSSYNVSNNQMQGQNFVSPLASGSISQDSTNNDPWYGQAMISGSFDDFDNLLGGYVDLAFPTNLWSSGLLDSSMDLSTSGNGGIR